MKHRYSLADLEALPTISTGHTDDLKVQEEGRRVWLARVGLEDGAEYAHGVTIEELHDGRWVTVDEYEAGR